MAVLSTLAAALMMSSVQTVPAPVAPEAAAPQVAPATPEAPVLTDDEQKTLTRCGKMDPQQRAQSSKCAKVMVKAGKGDPAKQIPASAAPPQG